MIILDMNQISVASLMMNMHMTKSDIVDEDMAASDAPIQVRLAGCTPPTQLCNMCT